VTDQLVPAPVHNGRRLDWFRRFDPASRMYAGAARARARPRRGRLWNPGRVLDQGAEGACCGFAAAAEAAAEPVPVPRITNRYARGWYKNAQRRDEWPGEQYDGTSVLATMKEGKARGLFGAYGWFLRVESLAHGLVADPEDDGGPAVVGVEWREGSYETDQLGVLRPSGQVVGGHALCVLGFVPADLSAMAEQEATALLEQLAELDLDDAVRSVLEDEPAAFIIQNSWGPTFGKNGLAVVPLSVMRGWFESRGEFAQPQQRQLPAQRKGSTMTGPEPVDQLEDVEDPDEQPATDVREDAELDELPEQRPGDETLHISATEVLEGDRILDPPDELGQESVTVRGTPRVIQDHRGRRVVLSGRVGTFTLAAGARVTVRRQVAG
jgi:hypothetical protein